jgi:hypothetical protein
MPRIGHHHAIGDHVALLDRLAQQEALHQPEQQDQRADRAQGGDQLGERGFVPPARRAAGADYWRQGGRIGHFADQADTDQDHREGGEQRGQRDDAESGQRVVLLPGGGGDADAQRQHQRHGHRSGGDRAAIPGQADDRCQASDRIRHRR